MSIFGKIFGTTKAVEETVSHGLNILDDAFHTDQEKTKERIDMVNALQDEFTPRAITRRILAVFIYANTFLHINVYLFYPPLYRLVGVDNALQVVSKELELAMIVTFFYFGYYGVKKVLGKKS